MRLELLCPACGLRDFDSSEYESMILLAQNLALVQFACPACGMKLSVTLRLTQSLYREASKRLAAQDTQERPPSRPPAISYTSHLVVEADPGAFHLVSPLRAGNAELKAQMDYFKRQLEKIDTVDEAIREIGSGYHREKRDG
jgi:predicted RNA-binding Zn-ribbon protein involved in translation (DUF1610 family)